MRQLTRLLRYVAPYWWQLLSSVAADGGGGIAGRLPGVADRAHFRPRAQSRLPRTKCSCSKCRSPGDTVDLQQFVPSHFHNAWTVVAFALVAATILKGIFDYAGTYLVNYAGFGMITDLRNELYNSILRRSAAFFQQHTTGHPDFHHRERHRAGAVRHVERAGGVSAAVIYLDLHRLRGGAAGRKAGLGTGAVCAVHHLFGGKNRAPGAAHHAPRSGQAGRHPEHSARDHHRQPHREGIQHGVVGDRALSPRRRSACSGPTCAPWRPRRSVLP